MTEYAPVKTGEYQSDIPNFQNCTCCKKSLKDNKSCKYSQLIIKQMRGIKDDNLLE